MRKIFALFLFFAALPLFCIDISGGHRGKVTALIHNGGTVISADEDGFIVIWSVSQKSAIEKFQLTTNGIKSMVKNPEKDEICIIESGGMGVNRISAWNYITKERLFSVQGKEPAAFINYSAAGNYIITAGFDGSHFTLLDSTNGETLSFVNIPSGAVAYGVTGKTEKNILLYQGENENFEGQILYLELETLSVIGRFKAPDNLSNPIVFGNNRFLAGISSSGLLVTDAASGILLDSIPNIEKSALLFPVNDGFFCFSRANNTLSGYTVDIRGTVILRQKLSVTNVGKETICAFAVNETAVFASEAGNLFSADIASGQQSRLNRMAHNFQARVMDIAANNSSLAFITEDGGLCFLPQDFSLIKDNDKFYLEKTRLSRLTAIAPFSGTGTRADPYILWQSANIQIPPEVYYSDYKKDELSLKFMTGRNPLRSISSKNDNILVLDSAGLLSVYNLKINSSKAAFTFSSVGAIDAKFLSDGYLLLCRSVINGNSPFLFINYNTGETVPVSFPAQAGILSFYGNSGKIYAAGVIKDKDSVKTVIYLLTLNKAVTEKLFEYPGEAVNLTIAESAGKIAAAGGEGAKILADKAVDFDRTEGLPVKLLGCKDFFLSLDSEGNISWHGADGKMLAVFRLYKDKWVLEKDGETIGGVLEYR